MRAQQAATEGITMCKSLKPSIASVAPMLGVLMALTATAASAADVDWKAHGSAHDNNGQGETCFFEAKGINRTPDRHIRVWTKCLFQKDIDNIDPDSDLGRRIVESATRKALNGYVPPLVVFNEVDFDRDRIVQLIMYEEAANISGIEPHPSIFLELDCSQKMERALSVRAVINGQYRSDDRPGNWRYIPPEGNGARLVKILCR
jgi:hypothetical protein